MSVFKNKIRDSKSHFAVVPQGSHLFLGVSDIDKFTEQARALGFTVPWVVGERVLPSANFGPANAENANGRTEVHRDRPMETFYQTKIWRWKMKRGYDFEEEERLVDVPRKRYPRTIHPPFGLELSVFKHPTRGVILALPQMEKGRVLNRQLVIGVNMLIEIFGEAELFSDVLALAESQVRRLNWRVLPAGRVPWDSATQLIQTVTEREPAPVREMIHRRFAFIKALEPDFLAVGQMGFEGYVVFGFSRENKFVLESLFSGNATYGLGQNWENLSKLTKAELLRNDLHEFRVIHTANWEQTLSRALNLRRAA